MNLPRFVIIAGWIALGLLLVSLDAGLGQIFFRPVDMTVLIVIALVLSGRLTVAMLAAITAGAFRSSMSVLPWGIYPIAYLIVAIMTAIFVRRIVAERSLASLAAASLVGSLAFPLTVIISGEIAHLIWPTSPHVTAIPWLISGAIQLVFQPLVLWWWWRVRSGGHFARVASSTLRPF